MICVPSIHMFDVVPEESLPIRSCAVPVVLVVDDATSLTQCAIPQKLPESWANPRALPLEPDGPSPHGQESPMVSSSMTQNQPVSEVPGANVVVVATAWFVPLKSAAFFPLMDRVPDCGEPLTTLKWFPLPDKSFTDVIVVPDTETPPGADRFA